MGKVIVALTDPNDCKLPEFDPHSALDSSPESIIERRLKEYFGDDSVVVAGSYKEARELADDPEVELVITRIGGRNKQGADLALDLLHMPIGPRVVVATTQVMERFDLSRKVRESNGAKHKLHFMKILQGVDRALDQLDGVITGRDSEGPDQGNDFGRS